MMVSFARTWLAELRISIWCSSPLPARTVQTRRVNLASAATAAPWSATARTENPAIYFSDGFLFIVASSFTNDGAGLARFRGIISAIAGERSRPAMLGIEWRREKRQGGSDGRSEAHAQRPGPRGREIQELGQVGAHRRDRHAQQHVGRGHRCRRAPGAQ